jgi:hypothetical protein
MSIAKFMASELEQARTESERLRHYGSQHADNTHEQITALREQIATQSALLHQQMITASQRSRHVETLKVEVSKYKAIEGESLLRWLVELDDAIIARNITDEAMRVTFATSNLAGRARAWALGLKLRDRDCFPSYEEFKTRLKQTFEPPKSEFRARSEFLELKQGKRDIHAYAQHARYLVSCVVQEPIDDQTQVVTYVKGLVDGPIKTHLFRMYPEDLERAIELSLEEAFSMQQAHIHSSSYKHTRRDGVGGPEPMDLSTATEDPEPEDLAAVTGGGSQSHGKKTCHRCKKNGHFAFECMAPRPANVPSGWKGKPFQGSRSANQQSGHQPKNGQGQ